MPRKQSKKKKTKPKISLGRITNFWKTRTVTTKIVVFVLTLLTIWAGINYAIAYWYTSSQASKPMKYGVTFIPSYARYLGVDPKETLGAMINDLGVRQYRFVSYWDKGEKVQGQYDFSELDWQFRMAEESGSKVSLAIGLRQPRWPECHMPKWAESMPMSAWSVELNKYMKATIDRYKNSPALESYQLENEFFLSVFGICPDFSRSRLVDEYNFVKAVDPNHPVIVSRSNNIIGVPVNEPIPDISAVSVYKRVWDKSYTHRYVEYPFPAWFYATLAGSGKILNGKDMIIHELQAEPWLPEGHKINDINGLAEQDKSMSAERMQKRIEYARATGIKEIYLWGGEWWYWRMVKADDPSIWQTVKEEIHRDM